MLIAVRFDRTMRLQAAMQAKTAQRALIPGDDEFVPRVPTAGEANHPSRRRCERAQSRLRRLPCRTDFIGFASSSPEATFSSRRAGGCSTQAPLGGTLCT
jgi:hypothetical protein